MEREERSKAISKEVIMNFVMIVFFVLAFISFSVFRNNIMSFLNYGKESTFEKQVVEEGIFSVNATDGIDKTEAMTIAHVFFESQISGCGFLLEGRKQGRFWIYETRIGYSGEPGGKIYIDDITGKARYVKDQATIESDLSELKGFEDK